MIRFKFASPVSDTEENSPKNCQGGKDADSRMLSVDEGSGVLACMMRKTMSMWCEQSSKRIHVHCTWKC